MVADRVRKSIGAETTFARDLTAWEDVPQALAPVFAKLWAVYAREGLAARTVTVKVKYADFRLLTRARTEAAPIAAREEMERIGLDLLAPLFPPARGVRLLGVTLSHFDAADQAPPRQLALGLG